MFINRVYLSEIIGTAPADIRSAEEKGGRIIACLWSTGETKVVRVEDYQEHIKNRMKADKISGAFRTREIGIGFAIVGGIALLMCQGVSTTVNTSTGFIVDQQKVDIKNGNMTISGVLFLAGLALIAADRR